MAKIAPVSTSITMPVAPLAARVALTISAKAFST